MMEEKAKLLEDAARAAETLAPLTTEDVVGGTEEKLSARGWQVTDRERDLWSASSFTGQLFSELGRGETDLFEVTLLSTPGDVDDGEYEAATHDKFAILFTDVVDRVRDVLGEPDFVGNEYGEEGFPEEIEASQLALWQASSGAFMIAHTHDDSGLPFNIMALVDFLGGDTV